MLSNNNGINLKNNPKNININQNTNLPLLFKNDISNQINPINSININDLMMNINNPNIINNKINDYLEEEEEDDEKSNSNYEKEEEFGNDVEKNYKY